MIMPDADLSIIIPTLNEEKNIAVLLDNHRRQKNIHIELIIVDGGSSDRTLAIIDEFLEYHSLNIKVISSLPGRGLQMNRGAAEAGANELLFLHADTRIDDDSLLNTARLYLKAQQHKLGHDRIAGHFALRFERSKATAALGYYFYESKTHLNRLDTVNGDQGFMLSKGFFQSMGGFNESLAYMEDARLARKIFTAGQWITLPGVVSTSARRFETEGLRERQILNALLCNFDYIGLNDFFAAAANAYRCQDKSRRLNLRPFLQLTRKLATAKGFVRAIKLWYQTGSYVASNTWQLAFVMDCRRNYIDKLPPGQGPTPTMRFYDAWLAPIINSPPGRFTAMAVVFIWFYGLLLISGLRR